MLKNPPKFVVARSKDLAFNKMALRNFASLLRGKRRFTRLS